MLAFRRGLKLYLGKRRLAMPLKWMRNQTRADFIPQRQNKMYMNKKSIITALLAVMTISSWAQTLTKQQMLEDYDLTQTRVGLFLSLLSTLDE